MKYSPSSYAQILYETKDADAIVELLQRHWVLPWLPKILERFEELYQKKEGILRVTIKSARELPQSVKKEIENVVRLQFHKKPIEFISVLDPALLGGFRVESDEIVIPASLADKIEQLKMNLDIS